MNNINKKLKTYAIVEAIIGSSIIKSVFLTMILFKVMLRQSDAIKEIKPRISLKKPLKKPIIPKIKILNIKIKSINCNLCMKFLIN